MKNCGFIWNIDENIRNDQQLCLLTIYIVNRNNHATENMAEVVEHELMENVCNLKSYIKDTMEFLQKLNKIPQPLPGNSIIL